MAVPEKRGRIAHVATCSYIKEMMTVGIRELKNRLSEYLRLVRSGELVQVTDRGTVVAEIRAPGAAGRAVDIPDGLRRLALDGDLTPGLPNDPALYDVPEKPLLRGTTSQELLAAERGER